MLIHGAMSLKDKRRIVKSIKDRVSNTFNVSIAEVDEQDKHRKAILGLSMVSNEKKVVQQKFDKIIDMLHKTRGASVVDYQIDLI